MGFNEEKDEINHKTLQTDIGLVEWQGSRMSCVISGGREEKVSMENILISQ